MACPPGECLRTITRDGPERATFEVIIATIRWAIPVRNRSVAGRMRRAVLVRLAGLTPHTTGRYCRSSRQRAP